jgi:hypothetical protein
MDKPVSRRSGGAKQSSAKIYDIRNASPRDKAASDDPWLAITERRIALWRAGYKIVPNLDKKCVCSGWSAPRWISRELTDSAKGTVLAKLERWPRRFPDWWATGALVWRPLCVIDIDISDAAMVAKLDAEIARIAPEVAARAPRRTGGGAKVALFTRLGDREAVFGRLHTDKFRRPGDAETAPTHGVEIFGGRPTSKGTCHRQFGIDGPRSHRDDGTVETVYGWAADRPMLHEVPLLDLPIISQDQALAILDAAERLAIETGWTRVERPDDRHRTGGASGRVYDIDEETRFDLDNGESAVSYDELCSTYWAARGQQLRCASNFIKGDSAGVRRDKCQVGAPDIHQGEIGIWNWETTCWHFPKELDPSGGYSDWSESPLGDWLRAVRDRYRAKHGDNDNDDWRFQGIIIKPDEAPPPTTKLEVFNAGEDIDPPPPRAWLLGNTFCREFLSELFGDGAVGKSALRYAQMLALASGRPITGEHVFQRCRVLVVCLEDSRKELQRRILAARKHHHITPEELDGWLFYVTPKGKDGKLMTLDKKGQTMRGALAASLEETIKQYAIDLVMIDPFVKVHSVEENGNSAIDDVVQVLTDLADKYNIATDCTHHTSKGSPDPGNADRGRGASALKDAGRLIYTITKMSAEEAERFGVPVNERKQYVRVDNAKVNLVKDAGEAVWYRLVNVALGNGTETYKNGDHVQTVEPWKPPPLWSGMPAGAFDGILAEIDKGLPDGDRYTHSPRTTARSAWPVVVELANKTEKQARAIIKDLIDKGVLRVGEYTNAKNKRVTGLFVSPANRANSEHNQND